MQAWWLGDNDQGAPAVLTLFSEHSRKEQNELFGYGIAHFPELFGTSGSKYKRLAIWLATEKSIVAPCLRDDFSAGGQVDMVLNGTAYRRLPQIYYRVRCYRKYILEALEAADPQKLGEDWGMAAPGGSIKQKTQAWIAAVSLHIDARKLPDGVTPYRILSDILSDADE